MRFRSSSSRRRFSLDVVVVIDTLSSSDSGGYMVNFGNWRGKRNRKIISGRTVLD